VLEELHPLTTLQENHQRPSLTIGSHCWKGNRWTEEEKLLQLAGYLRGRARQEWVLLAEDSKKCYSTAIESLRNRLEDFICRLEHTFKLAYGRQEQPFSMIRCKIG